MRRITKRERVLVGILFVLTLVGGWFLWRMQWRGRTALETEHYRIESAATESETEAISQVIETLYATYSQCFRDELDLDHQHPRLQFRLYKNRAEFKRCNPHVGWAEAYYGGRLCHAYSSVEGESPYHWVIHEATHQLNAEVAHLKLKRWMDEGLACYFSTSQFRKGRIHLGNVDRNTYPVWWIGSLALSGNLRRDMDAMKLIPLDRIIRDRNLRDMDRRFNLYYIHWWSLTHFLFNYDNGKYRKPYLQLIKEGFSVPRFEALIGPIDTIETEWYKYLYGTLLGRRGRPSDGSDRSD